MKTRIDSPIGPIVLAATSSGLTHACFESRPKSVHSAPEAKDPAARKHLDAACRALFEYFEGERSDFDDLVLAPEGTSFQQRVWRALRSLPYGRTTTYGRVRGVSGSPPPCARSAWPTDATPSRSSCPAIA